MRKTVVYALGGNALKPPTGEANDANEVLARVMSDVIDLLEMDWSVVITHGNGPQVGHLMAIDDANTQNACMRFIPRTHQHGHMTYHLSEKDENNVLFQTVPNAEEYGDPINVTLRAGEISMHSDMLLHGSEANQSDRRRCGLTLRYCAADVRAMQGWHLKGVVVTGQDREGHWGNPARPEED